MFTIGMRLGTRTRHEHGSGTISPMKLSKSTQQKLQRNASGKMNGVGKFPRSPAWQCGAWPPNHDNSMNIQSPQDMLEQNAFGSGLRLRQR